MLYEIILLLFSVTNAFPTTLYNTTSGYQNKSIPAYGFSFDGNPNGLPLLALPYATYRAKLYEADKDYYLFANIRFAAPPIGDLRFAKPRPPPNETEIQDGSVGFACHQTAGNELSSAYFETLQPVSEDCLFHDIYVPGKAVRKEVSNLPVLNWIYGGGFVFGSKDMWIYDTGMWVEKAKNNLIYVAGNYRMGAFGWLCGPTVEKEATANAGLHDQRALLKWIQDYIHYAGGDKNLVTAWGLSSGSGSIMHHLTARGGKSNPLFQRAILNSPASIPSYDPLAMEQSFEEFTGLLNCLGRGIACLRKVSEAALQFASVYVSTNTKVGQFGFGPAIDREYIQDFPGREIAKGNSFVDTDVTTPELFELYLAETFSQMAATSIQQLLRFYPESAYQTTYERLANLIGKWGMTCNTRWLAQAYEGQTWGYRFSMMPGIHGEDAAFDWWRINMTTNFIEDFGMDFLNEGIHSAATIIQSFISSFALTGNPNTHRSKMVAPLRAIDVPLVAVGSTLNLLDISSELLEVVDDAQTIQDECDWWQSAVWTGLKYPYGPKNSTL